MSSESESVQVRKCEDSLERYRRQLAQDGLTEGKTKVYLEDLGHFMKACAQRNVTCTQLGTTSIVPSASIYDKYNPTQQVMEVRLNYSQ